MQRFVQKIAQIDRFKGKWELLEQKNNVYLKELRRIATIQSIGSSTRIEGASLSNEEVRIFLENVTIAPFDTRDEQEVAGYYQVLELILNNYREIPLTENFIKQLHGILLKYSQKDERHRGEYKSLPNTVIAAYPDGTARTLFEPAPPYLVKTEMERLLIWVNNAFAGPQIHPLLVIGIFIYEFLSIHPFQDGNGRLARLLTTLTLLRQDYLFVQYISFEHIIEQRKKDYYEALMHCQQRRSKEIEETIEVWIEFFLDCLLELIRKLEEKYLEYQEKSPYLNTRQKRIADVIQKFQPAKIYDIHAALQDVPMNTLKKDMKYLVDQGVVGKIGKNRGTIYISQMQKKTSSNENI
jgi:Fic family protein